MSVRRVRQGIVGFAAAIVFVLSLAMSTSVGATSIPDGAYKQVGCNVGNYACYIAKVGGQPYYGYSYSAPYGYGYANAYPYAAPVYGNGFGYGGGYQYTDNRFCGDGQVTSTPSGYFCTSTGVPAFRSDGAAPNYGGYTGYGYPNYTYTYPYYR